VCVEPAWAAVRCFLDLCCGCACGGAARREAAGPTSAGPGRGIPITMRATWRLSLASKPRVAAGAATRG
jgi:hypothetical protein